MASNSDRKNGKAWKKNPRTSDQGSTGRTQGGYSITGKHADKAAAWSPEKAKAKRARSAAYRKENRAALKAYSGK